MSEIKIHRKGKVRIIVGCILFCFQLVVALCDRSAFDIPQPQTSEQFLYDTIYYLSYFCVGIVGLILIISGVVSYKKTGVKKETNNKKTKVHPTLKIVLLSLLISSLCTLGIPGGIAIIIEWSYCDGYGVAVGIIWTILSIVLLFLCIRALYKACLQQRSVNRRTIHYKEKCYKKIDKIHGYYERGSITQEEFESLKKEILSKIE